MKFSSVGTLALLAAIAAQSWALVLAVRNKRAATSYKAEALAQFQRSSIDGADRRYCFSGAAAKIVREDEFGPIQGIFSKRPEYRLTIYATNVMGEYFVFRSTQHGTGSVKHLEPKLASVVLKDLYVEPSKVVG